MQAVKVDLRFCVIRIKLVLVFTMLVLFLFCGGLHCESLRSRCSMTLSNSSFCLGEGIIKGKNKINAFQLNLLTLHNVQACSLWLTLNETRTQGTTFNLNTTHTKIT